MAAIQLTDTLVGASYAEKGGYFSHSSGTSPISQRPLFGVALREQKLTRQSRILRKGLIVSAIIEKKEFEFKPSFDEYLKAMESVKAKRNVRKNKENRENEEDKVEVESLVLRDRKFEKSEGQKINNVKFEGPVIGILDDESKMNERVKIVAEKKVEFEAGRVKDYSRKSEVNDRVKIVAEKKVEFEGGKVKDYSRKDKKVMVYSGFDSEDVDDDRMERAAFKSFDENAEAYDKPRVTRLDMEDRIQKLAKCLNGADIDMPEWMFSNMMRSAKIKFSDHTILRIIQILGKLGNWKRVLQVIDWVQSRERFKSHKIRYVYTAALDALKKARRPVEALNLFYAMQQHMSSYPDLVAYHCIAVILGQAGYMKELFDVIDSMRSPPQKKFKLAIVGKWDPRLEPDIVVYNAVLNSCVVRKNWEGAFWVLQQLKEQGQKPSTTTYGLVMEVMYASGKYNLVHDFFRKVQKSCIPNALTYKVLVNTLSKEGKVEEAISAVKDMERRGIVGTASLYYDLARCLCSAGRCQEALMQIKKICRVASKPLVVTYTGLIQACLDSGDVKSATYIFSQMQNFCSPNLITCNIMLKTYLDHGMFEEGKQLFLSLLQNCNYIKNKSDYRDKVIPDIYTFNTMLDACAEKQRWDDLEFVYLQMLKFGFHFNSKRHLRIILDASNTRKGELLEATWEHLVRSDHAPPPLLIRAMFCKRLEQGDYAAALSCISEYAYSESPVFSAKSWRNFLAEHSHQLQRGALEALVQHVNLLSRKDSPNVALENLLRSCEEILRTEIPSAGCNQTVRVQRPPLETASVC